MSAKRPEFLSSHPETLALHAGHRADLATGAVAVPIYQTTSYQFQDAEHAQSLFALCDEGDFYTRVSNPTVRALEQRVAAMEGGIAACCVSSGQAASCASIQNLAKSGDNIVAANNLYGGTMTLLRFTLKNQGIEVRFVDPDEPQNFPNASDERTRAWFGEALPNPNLNPFPIGEVATLGKPLGIPLIIDNTCAPLVCRPFDHGAAIVVHSLTKYYGGSGNSLAGVIIDGGTHQWQAARSPSLCTPDSSYHQIIWIDTQSHENNSSPFIQRLRFCLLRDVGFSLSPINAFLILQGMETLPLRMRAHTENAAKVATFLSRHEKVKSVFHPSLMEGIRGERAEKYLKNRASGLVGFILEGSAQSGGDFINALQLFYHVSNIGDTRSLATMPSSTTHAQLDEGEKTQSSVCDTFIRLSIGIEHIDDILADLHQALASIKT